MIYQLKTVNPYFKDLENGKKDFEIRLNDNDYQIGNKLLLCEYNPLDNSFSGKEILKEIKYIIDLSEIMDIEACSFWSDEEIKKYGIVILGLK